MPGRTYVGFGFGAIQGGLFLYEAHRSGNFDRLVVAEVMADVVKAVRDNGGRYKVNIATRNGIEKREVRNVELLNPGVAGDLDKLISAVADASEITTALPSVDFYRTGTERDVASVLSAGLALKVATPGLPAAIIYTAENNNHAAEILGRHIQKCAPKARDRYQCLNTVIGKMSGVVSGRENIASQKLAAMAEGLDRAFLVEEFCRIFISRITLPGHERGIGVFEEKRDLLPFEEAKLYGHNATHALIGYLLRLRGRDFMVDAKKEKGMLIMAREAFMEESGRALCRKYKGIDPLFTEEGFMSHVDDLLDRMMNPYLRDTVERVTRDSRRKLGWNDRLVGTMRMVLEQGVTPSRFAMGAAAAVKVLSEEEKKPAADLIEGLWRDNEAGIKDIKRIKDLVRKADKAL